jgi:hypothetical protein
MIRIVIATVKIVLAFLIALLFQNCTSDKFLIEGSGEIVSEIRPCATDITGISVKNGINVVLIQGKVPKITVSADDNIIKQIETTCKGTTLHIGKSAKLFLKNETVQVTVQIPVISRIEASTAAHIKSQQTINTKNISLEATTGSEINLTTEAVQILADATTGSAIILNGKALSIELSAATGSTFNAHKLLANNVWSNATSGATVSVHPLVSLDAEASTGGVIHFEGNPKKIRKLEITGGTVVAD